MNLNPGIVKVVEFLNDNNFVTVDSGDGCTHDHECDREYAYVVIQVSPEDAIDESNRLLRLLRAHNIECGPLLGFTENVDQRPFIQVTYSPIDNLAFIDLQYLTDADLPNTLK